MNLTFRHIISGISCALGIMFFSTDANSQCDINRHNTSWNDAWTSCDARSNPNAARAESHWILYNFGTDFELQNSHIWNLNDPKNLESGVNEIVIDHSIDGVNWYEWGSFSVTIADGSSVYSGTEGPNLEGIIAQYVLVTAVSNHGGECYGFSEIKFEINNDYIAAVDNKYEDFCFTANLSPNPTIGNSILNINSNCGQDMSYRIIDAIGNIVVKSTQLQKNENEILLNSSKLTPGVYFVEIINQGKIKSLKFIKMK